MKIAAHTAKKRIALRPLSALSLLPASSFLGSNASLVIGNDISFSAVRIAEDEDYFELAWAAPEEIALLASITIGAHPDYGKVHFFPARWPTNIEDEGQDLSDHHVLELAEACLTGALSRETGLQGLNSWEELPPAIVGRPYKFNPNVHLSDEYQAFLFEQISLDNHLMIRGLSHLLKCAMLKCLSRSFIDTACLEIYVALEATLEIILLRLRSQGEANPSNKDASDYLLEAFGEPYRLEKYYEPYYEDRIKAVHPNSRFGVAKFTPLYVDDLYMLYDDLLRNYEFLITGKTNCYREW